MLAFHWMHYKIVLDPAYAFEFLSHLWTKEPAGMLGICITVTGLLLTLTFKFLDVFLEWKREVARQGKLRIELEADLDIQGQIVLWTVVSNTGREPVVIRDIGALRARWLGKEFERSKVEGMILPHALNARELVRIPIVNEKNELLTLLDGFRVKDSMGKYWEAPEREIRIARRQLKNLSTQTGRQAQMSASRQAMLNQIETSPPLTTQN